MRPLRLQLLALTAALVAAGTVSDGGSGAPASTPAADAALFSAVNKDSRMRIERALDDGADINAQDSKTGYFTPLMLAATGGNVETVQLLASVSSGRSCIVHATSDPSRNTTDGVLPEMRSLPTWPQATSVVSMLAKGRRPALCWALKGSPRRHVYMCMHELRGSCWFVHVTVS